MRPVLVFDLNGTLTDIAVLDSFFQQALGSTERRREWFTQLIELAMTRAASGDFIPFSKLAEAALLAVAARQGLTLSDQQVAELKERVRNLPVFPDVSAGLEKLHQAEYRLAVLTNSARETGEYTLQRAGVLAMFERVLSVEMVKSYKPLPEVYHFAARELGIAPEEVMMVAAHNWDTTGALLAGCRAAFLARPGEVLAVTDPPPEIIAADVLDLANKLA